MNSRVHIDIVAEYDGEDVNLSVMVTGEEVDVFRAVGIMEMAKLQHLESKKRSAELTLDAALPYDSRF